MGGAGTQHKHRAGREKTLKQIVACSSGAAVRRRLLFLVSLALPDPFSCTRDLVVNVNRLSQPMYLNLLVNRLQKVGAGSHVPWA